jgi:4-oxalocrotonate tautomerase
MQMMAGCQVLRRCNTLLIGYPPPSIRRQLEGSNVPYVNVKITRDGVTAEQKAQIVAEITATLQRVLGKRPEHIHIVIDEIDPENWGYAGMLTTEWRNQKG